MSQVWKADSEAVLETLRSSPLRESRSQQFHTLFGYLLGNREGIDDWRLAPSKLRRCIGRKTLASKHSKPLLSTTLFQSISAPPIRSAWCQFRGGGLEALLIPEVTMLTAKRNTNEAAPETRGSVQAKRTSFYEAQPEIAS